MVGTDIDRDALASGTTNSALDAHAVAIAFSADPPDHWGARFDLIVANILEGPLRELAAALGRALAPYGVLAISGFTRAQGPALRVHFERAGVHLVGESHFDEWALLVFEKGSPQSPGG